MTTGSEDTAEVLTRLRGEARTERPQYFDDPAIDRVLAIAVTLAQEVGVAVERLDTLERVLDAKGMVSPEDLREYEPSAEVQQDRLRWHQAFVTRLLGVLEQEYQSLSRSD